MASSTTRLLVSIIALALALVSPARVGAQAAEPVPTDRIILVSVDPAVDGDEVAAALDPDGLLEDLEGLGLDIGTQDFPNAGFTGEPLASWNQLRTQIWFLVVPPAADPAAETDPEGEAEETDTTVVGAVVPVDETTEADPVCAADGRGNEGASRPAEADDLTELWAAIEATPNGASARLICSVDAFDAVVRDVAVAVGGFAWSDPDDAVSVALTEGRATYELDLPQGIELESVAVRSPVALNATTSGTEVMLEATDEVPEDTQVELVLTLRLGQSDITWVAAEPVLVTLDGWSPVDPRDPADEDANLLLPVVAVLLSALLGAGAGYLVGRRGRRDPAVVDGGRTTSRMVFSLTTAPVGGVTDPAAPLTPFAEGPPVEAPPEPPSTVLPADLLILGSPPDAPLAPIWGAAWPVVQLGDEPALLEDVAYVGSSPGLATASLIWASDPDDPPVLGIYTEKKIGQGEDAEPSILRKPSRRGRNAVQPPAFVAVYDGLGGSGSSIVELRSGQTFTQAYLASRLVREATERFVVASAGEDGWDAPDAFATRLQAEIQRTLAIWEKRLPANQSKIRSRMQAPFPTTFAGASIEAVERGRNADHRVTAIWAGDSRVYLLTEDHGLQQLSADHTRDSDILGQLIDDGPMTQKVSAGNAWSFSTSSITVPKPFAVLCATDGVHGYVQTPGGLEALLVATLDRAGSTREWGELLSGRIAGYTGDDATVALASVGFGSFKDLRKALTRRLDWLHETQVRPFELVDRSDDAAVRACREATWATYRDAYTTYLPAPPAPAPPEAIPEPPSEEPAP